MEISEAVASLNFREFVRNNADRELQRWEHDFESSILFSFPSTDKLMELFLLKFELTKELYESSMSRCVARVISLDHTFKTSKYIGITRDDGKFVRQFQNVFICMNEIGEVLAWRFTKSTSGEEVQDLLNELSARLTLSGTTLEMIIVDDCCHVKNLYSEAFPGVPLKLDLFHACMRIVQTVPKSEARHQKIANDFSLIFRYDDDTGSQRTMNTPDPETIEGNLERFIFCWRPYLRMETLHEIGNLRRHIRKGCLSGIPPGCGTEMNERLHRHLNRSLLCGVSKIGPELAVAAMTCALYAWNSKRRRSKESNSKRTVPVVPVETVKTNSDSIPNTGKHMKVTSSSLTTNQASSLPCNATHLSDILNDDLLNCIVERILHMQEFIGNFKKQCVNKTIDVISYLWSMGVATDQLIEKERQNDLIGFDLRPQHEENMKRNLSGFNLTVDEIPRDGNCFFRSVIRQLNRHLETFAVKQHVCSLGLGVAEENDAMRLRQLFVNELLTNKQEYKEWLTEDCTEADIEMFKRNGFFTSELGDLCAKACANVLKIPLVLITALPDVPSVPFIPKSFVTTSPIFIAYDHSGPGHYNATKGEYSVE